MSQFLPELGDQVPRSNRPLRKFIGRLYMRFFGWRIEGNVPNVRKMVTLGTPHTSNWDLPVSVAIGWALDMRVRWMVKSNVFKPPWAWLFRSLDGFPVNRDAPGGIIQQVVDEFDESEEGWVLVIAPEGTRSKVPRWKTGFHRIAKQPTCRLLPLFSTIRKKSRILSRRFILVMMSRVMWRF